MPSEQQSDRHKKSSANSKAKSSLVHKPFATGTINIFNPHRGKGGKKTNPPKLFLNAELERDLDRRKTELELSKLDLEPNETEDRDSSWVDGLFGFWGISAIAILVSINLISAGFIWRSTRNPANTQEDVPVATIGNKHLGDREFVPLNLSTLGTIETIEDEVSESIDLDPIAPALAPIDNIANISLVNTPYHYILTEYTGEESLSLARQKVPQVSLVNFPQGVLIYLGAFKNREDADKFVDRLKQEDFSATVYPLE